MKRVARFEKVSFEQFENSWDEQDFWYTFEANDYEYKKVYDKIKLPVRATTGSAGYDFVSPFDFSLMPGEGILIPSGVRVHMEKDYVLMCYPRSGLGFKFRMQLDNSTAIIDSDYYYSSNEGHIMFKITNDSKSDKTLEISAGDKIIQGIFMQFGITVDDDVSSVRNGGFGSTDKSE